MNRFPSILRRRWVALLLLAAVVFLVRLGHRELWSPDEPRFGLMTQEMLRGGEIVVPRLQGEIYSNKPPLYLWAAVLVSSLAGGVSEWTVRLPSALAAIGSVLLTFFLGRRFWGERAGWIAALVLMTAGHFLQRGRWAATDMTLAFFFLLSVSLLAVSLGVGREGRVDPAAAGRWFFVAAALATLTKGPVGLVLPIGILVTYLLVERRPRDLLRFPWLGGTALFLLIVTPWYLLYGLQAGGGKLGVVLITENVSRYLNAWNNVRPWYYYLHRFPLSFLPWSVLFPALLLALGRRWAGAKAAPVRFLSIWFGIVFLFFSISSGKRTVYLLPLFPAVALLTGWFLDRGRAALGTDRSGWLRGSFATLGVLLLAAGAAVPALAATRLPGSLPAAVAVGAALAIGGLLVSLGGGRGRVAFATHAAAAAILVAALAGVIGLVPAVDRHQNVRALSEQIVKLVPPGSRFATSRKKREAFFFYTGMLGEEIRSGEDLDRVLGAGEPAYCLLLEREWERFAPSGDSTARVLLRGTASRHSYVLVSNEVMQ